MRFAPRNKRRVAARYLCAPAVALSWRRTGDEFSVAACVREHMCAAACINAPQQPAEAATSPLVSVACATQPGGARYVGPRMCSRNSHAYCGRELAVGTRVGAAGLRQPRAPPSSARPCRTHLDSPGECCARGTHAVGRLRGQTRLAQAAAREGHRQLSAAVASARLASVVYMHVTRRTWDTIARA